MNTLLNIMRSRSSDLFQSPPEIISPLLPYLRDNWTIWEPFCGECNIADNLQCLNYNAVATDLNVGVDFFGDAAQPYLDECDVIISNPPYSLKDTVLRRLFESGKKFAMLLPVSALGAQERQELYKNHGVGIIMLGGRVNFKCPSGEGSGAWFEVAWFTHGLGFDGRIIYTDTAKHIDPLWYMGEDEKATYKAKKRREAEKRKKTTMKVKELSDAWVIKCPAGIHDVVRLPRDGTWKYNGNSESPTFTPSVLIRGYNEEEAIEYTNHFFVTEGRIEFLSDCTHSKASTTMELPRWTKDELLEAYISTP